MKKKINKFLFMVLIPVVVCMTAGILAFSGISDAYTSVRALSGNGGIIYVGSGSKLNMTNGSLYGGTATNGGAVYVASGGTFNMSGGSIYGNTATNGNNIYNAGTFTMTGGKVGKQVLARVDENGNKSETGNYVYFGSYPQTLKASSVTIDASSVDGNGYYLGSDGERYLKLTAHAPYVGNIIYDFSDGSTITVGSTYYFKVEPIKWKIVNESDGKLTLYAESVLDQTAWSSSNGLNYKESTVRKFINSTFYDTAFSTSEKSLIQTTEVDNSASTLEKGDDALACENTNDKVFLFSIADVSLSTGSLGYTSMGQRKKVPTDFAKASGLFMESTTDENKNNAMYWTRSPSSNKLANMAYDVVYNGDYSNGGVTANLGVAPAIVVSNSETDNGYGIYNTGTMNLYGGTVYDDIYSTVSFSTKMACNIAGTMTLGDNATITLQDYAGTTPSYTIVIDSTRGTGTILTFKGNSTEPDLSKLNIMGFDTDSYKLKTEKDASGNWTVVLYSYALMLPSNWETQVASTTYMTTTLTPANLTSIKFVATVPSGYTKIGTLSTGLPVYQGTTATEIAFVAEKIYAPENSSGLFSSLSKLTIIDTTVFDTSKVIDMSRMFIYCSSLTNLDVSDFNTLNVTNMYAMFHTCSKLTDLDLSNFNTLNVVNMSYMFTTCSNLTDLDLRSFNTSNVTNMSRMFNECSSLPSLNLSSFVTSNVTNMSGMFYRCLGLTSLDLRNFNTSNVTDMSKMFSMWLKSTNKLANIDVSNFDTSKVTDMSNMFEDCSSLTSIDISKFNTQNVTNMSRMFYDCSGLESLSVSNFDTSKVTDMSNMFDGCSSLTSLDVSNFNTSNVTAMKYMFAYCSGITSLDVSNFDTAKVTDMSSMFFSCRGLTSLDVSNFVTTKVTDMSGMFSSCSGITSLDVSNFDTTKVTNMSGMFFICSNLTNLDLSNFNTSNVTNMYQMFIHCSGLTSLDLRSFDTSNVTDMRYMFEHCSGLESLDLSNFVTSKVTDMTNMFAYCSGLTSLDVSNFNTSNVSNMQRMFSSCSGLTSLDLSSFNMSKVTSYSRMFNFGSSNKIETFKTPYNNTAELPITTGSTLYNAETGEVVTSVPANTTKSLTYVNENPIKIFPTTWKTELGSIFNSNYQDDSAVTLIRFEKTVPTGYTSFGTLSTGIKVYQKNYKEIAFVAQSTIFAPENSSSLFASVAYTSILFNNFDTSKVTNMNQMFSSCSSLETADISGFNTSKVTDMNAIFSGCHKWTNIDVSNFNTTQVTDMTSMFSGCFAVTSLNVRSFNTSKVTNMAYMFLQCKSLKSLDASNFDTSNVTDMTVMFYECSSLETLDVSGFNMTKVVDSGYFSQVFYFGSSNAIKIFKTPYNNTAALAITTGSSLYVVANGTKYTSVPASTSTSLALRAANTISFNYNGGSGSESSRTVLYGLTIGTLPSASQSGYTFNGWYTSSSGGSRFSSSTVVTQTQVLYAHWTENTPTPDPDPDPPTPPDPGPEQPSDSISVDSIEYLIFTTPNNVPSGLNQRVGIDYNSRSAFVQIPSDPTIYANEDGTRVAFVGNPGELIAPTDCSNLFAELESLKWVIFRNYDTFYSTNFSNMFQGCTSLEFVDMLSIQTPNVTAMDYMFQGCSVLKQIALAKFDCINLVSASYMFNGCIDLGNNPVYSGNVSLGGVESVVIDSFPMLEYTYNLQDAQYMFADSNWPTFYMPHFFTDSLSNVTGMFENCNVDILDLSQFVCKNFDPSGIVGSGSLNPRAVYTPRYCHTSSFMSIFDRTYVLPNGESIGIFDDLGYEGTIPFSLCFVESDNYASGLDVYQFTLVYNEWGFDELERLIREMLEFSGISSFSGDINNLTIKTFSPLRDVYYLLPIPYEIGESTGEEAFAGWVGVSQGTTAGGGVSTDELFYNDFTGRTDFFGGSGYFMAVGWLDAMIDGPNNNNYGDVSSGTTPYTEWFNNQRNRLARVRYLPSCHGTDGQIFRGWYNENIGFISYYSNIAPLSDAGGPAWWESMTVGFHDLGLVQQYDYWELPSGNSSFVSNASLQEKDLERMMNLYETNKQEILIPEDKKVTITELKIDKIA